MKKIGIDVRLYSQTGVGTYLQNLLHYLDKTKPKDEIYYLYFRKQDALKIKSKFNSKNIVIRIADQKWHTFSEQISFLFILLKDNLDLMHFTYFSYPILYWKKFIATVHDVTPLLHKTGKASTKNQFIYKIKHFLFRLVLRFQVSKALKIITPTKTVKKELIRIYGDQISSKILPIYEGVAWKMIRSSNNIQDDNNISDKNFFIYVGNFYPHKNVERLIQAFSKIKTNKRLLLLGPDDFFTNKILKLIHTLRLEDRVFLKRNSTTEDLIFYYKNAQALIHPSLSEGFGLPLLEATYFNCPIIASNIAVFKELLEDNYLPFNPTSTIDIKNKIEYFIKNKPTFNYKKIIPKYSFEKMTRSTLALYKQLI